MISIYRLNQVREIDEKTAKKLDRSDIEWAVSCRSNALLSSAYDTILLNMFSGGIEVTPAVTEKRTEIYLQFIGKDILRAMLSFGFCIIMNTNESPPTLISPHDVEIAFSPQQGKTGRIYYVKTCKLIEDCELYILVVDEPYNSGHLVSKLFTVRLNIEELKIIERSQLISCIRQSVPPLIIHAKENKDKVKSVIQEAHQATFTQKKIEQDHKRIADEREEQFRIKRLEFEEQIKAITVNMAVGNGPAATSSDPQLASLAINVMASSHIQPFLEIPSWAELETGPVIHNNVEVSRFSWQSLVEAIGRTFGIPDHWQRPRYINEQTNMTMTHTWRTSLQTYCQMVQACLEFILAISEFADHDQINDIQQEEEVQEQSGAATVEQIMKIDFMSKQEPEKQQRSTKKQNQQDKRKETTKYQVFITPRPDLHNVMELVSSGLLTPEATVKLLSEATSLPPSFFRVPDEEQEDEEKPKKKPRSIKAAPKDKLRSVLF